MRRATEHDGRDLWRCQKQRRYGLFMAGEALPVFRFKSGPGHQSEVDET